VTEVDGHDLAAVLNGLRAQQQIEDQPSLLIAHTIKGKGVSFVEQDFTYHGRPILGELADQAREELSCS
jgi:transketolase